MHEIEFNDVLATEPSKPSPPTVTNATDKTIELSWYDENGIYCLII